MSLELIVRAAVLVWGVGAARRRFPTFADTRTEIVFLQQSAASQSWAPGKLTEDANESLHGLRRGKKKYDSGKPWSGFCVCHSIAVSGDQSVCLGTIHSF